MENFILESQQSPNVEAAYEGIETVYKTDDTVYVADLEAEIKHYKDLSNQYFLESIKYKNAFMALLEVVTKKGLFL